MRIERLHIENFRKYANGDFVFHPHFNLVIGENGAGKTSLLEALAVAIGSWLLGIRGYDSRHIKRRDIRREAQFIGKRFVFRDFAPVKVEAWGEVAGQPDIHWSRELGSRDPHSRTTYKNAASIRELAEELGKKANDGKEVILPLISYYGADRLWALPPDSDRETSTKSPSNFSREIAGDSDADLFSDRFLGYRYSVDDRSDLKSLMRWMAYERRVEIDEEDQSPYLRTVLATIDRCLPEHVKRVRYSIRQETLMFDFDDGRIIPMSDLSDGYRTMIAIIGDIACKAVLLNPHLNGEAINKTPGVVLIDELDQHLHPRWQRRIIEDLRGAFPEIQFICTTHSPFLIQSLQSSDELIVLADSLISGKQRVDADGLTEEELATADLEHLGIEAIASGIMGVPADASPRYLAMLHAARDYLAELDVATRSPADRLENYKQCLANRLAPYADNPAFQAVLEAEKSDKLGRR